MTILALLTLLAHLGALLEIGRGMRRVHRLGATPASIAPRTWPSLSVVIAARDEEANVEHTLRSMLALDYPGLHVVLVDDRSTDRTHAIARAVAREDPRLRVLQVAFLPGGWVGKSHALTVGAQAAAGDLLLFTDADVVMAPEAARRAVALLEAQHLDHLAVAPRIVTRSFPLAVAMATFGLFFMIFSRPWRVPIPGTREHIGIGAFNLVRRRTYEAIGTHARIALAPDDDLQLGKAIKVDGHRSALALSDGLVAVEWYPSVRALVDGLMKNAFAGLGYRVSAVVASVAALLVINVWPFVALAVVSGPAWWMNLAVVLSAVALFVTHARLQGGRGGEVVGYPLATLLFCWVLVRAAWLALSTGAIEWRGRSYRLEELRATRLR